MLNSRILTGLTYALPTELQEALKAYRSKAESYLGRLEKSESEKAKAISKADTGMSITNFLNPIYANNQQLRMP